MAIGLYDHGYGYSWKNLLVLHKEGYYTSVADFHEHEFYEVNLILSGNFKILLKDREERACGSRIVLTRPRTPHFISCSADTLYSRVYLLFSEEFMAGFAPEWEKLNAVFLEKGNIVTVSDEQKEVCKALIDRIQYDTDPFRQRLLICYLISYIAEFAGMSNMPVARAPSFVMDALAYIEQHHSEKIVAAELASMLYIGRTTLMTAFKKYTGTTLNEYLTHCRLKTAVRLLREGKTEQTAAELCGLYDSSGLIRCFKQRYGVTPRQYLLREQGE